VICSSCADEADGVIPKRADCWKCGKSVSLVKGSGTHSLSWQNAPRYHYHKRPIEVVRGDGVKYLARARCDASGKSAVWGHAACPGCDCRHKRPGTNLPAKIEVVDVDARTIEVWK
jgi:uncharacterized OB-fold protein